MQAVLGAKRVIRDELRPGLILNVFATFSCRAATGKGDRAALGHFQSIDVWSTTCTPISCVIILIDGVNGHILILIVEDVVVQDVIVASLFFKKVSIDMSVLFIRVDSDKASPALIFKH